MSKLVTVESFLYVGQADVLREALDAAGIPAYLADANIITMDWFIGTAVGGVKVQVASEHLQKAQEILAKFRAAEKSRQQRHTIHVQCEDCGQELVFENAKPGGIETCYGCGKYVDLPDIIDFPNGD